MTKKLYSSVRCSKHHHILDTKTLKQYIEVNRCPICIPVQIKMRSWFGRRVPTPTCQTSDHNHVNTTVHSTLQGKCNICEEWYSLSKMSRHVLRKHNTNSSQPSQSTNTTHSLTTTTRHTIPRHLITPSDRSTIPELLTPSRIVIGAENIGLFTTHQRTPRQFIGNLQRPDRQRHIHSLLNLLRSLLNDDTSFVLDLLQYPEITRYFEEQKKAEYNKGVEDGVKLFANHIKQAAPMLMLATGTLGSVWDRIVTVLCNTAPILYQKDEDVVQLIQNVNMKYTCGVKRDKPQTCLQKLQNRILGAYCASRIDEKGGYAACQEQHIFTKVAKDVAKWCLDHDSLEIRMAASTLFGTSGGHHLKLIYCWTTGKAYSELKRYRTANVRLTSTTGGSIQLPSLPRADCIMVEHKQKLVGMTDTGQIRSCVKGETIYYLDKSIDIQKLALSFGYTYVGDVIHRTGIDGEMYRFRYFDSRVLLLTRLYKLHNLGLINNDLCGEFTLELTEWHDDSKVESHGFGIHMELCNDTSDEFDL